MYLRHSDLRVSCRFLCSGLLFAILIGSLQAAATESSALPDAFRSEDLLWEIQLGTHQYTIPRIDDGNIFIGINDRGLSILLCIAPVEGS